MNARAITALIVASPLFGSDTGKTLEMASTEVVQFVPRGVVHVEGAFATLSVEGWDRNDVQITLSGSPDRQSGLNSTAGAAPPERVRLTAKRKSDNELFVSIVPPPRGGAIWPFRRNSHGGLTVSYELHVPRESKLVVRHGTGFVFVSDVTGDVNATCSRGDILIMLRESGAKQIDAVSRFGTVSSDFAGTAHVSRYLLGEYIKTDRTPSAQDVRLRMGFGGITIKAVPPEGISAR